MNPFKALFGKGRRRPGFVEAAVLNATGKLDVASVSSVAIAADLNATGVLNAVGGDLRSSRHVRIKVGDQVLDISSPEAKRIADNIRKKLTHTITIDRSLIPDLELGDLISVDNVPYKVVGIRQVSMRVKDTLEVELSADTLEDQKPEDIIIVIEEFPEDKVDINYELNQ